jgi:resuscitation-promoting factor RpfA
MSNHERTGPPSAGKDAVERATRDAAQDTALKRAWQQASDEQPPPALDAAIIAVARKSLQERGAESTVTHASPKSRPSANARRWWMQWQPLAAAATVAGLAFILVQLMPRDRDVAPSIRMEERVPGPALAEDKAGNGAPAASSPGATAEERSDVNLPAAPAPQAKAVARDNDNAATARASGSTVTTEAPATAAASQGTTATPAIEADQRAPAATGMARPAAPAAAVAPPRARSSSDASPIDAEDRVARIAELYASGRITDAADALRAFRAVDPDADSYLPDSLRDWARSVR